MEYVTITDPGKTTFNVGEVVSRETFDRENERVTKLGEKPATGRPSSPVRDKISIPIFDPLGVLEKITKDAPVGLYDPVGAAIRDTLRSTRGSSGGESRFIGGCKVSNGLCLTHGYSVSKTVKCPKSELTDEEWSAVWDLVEEAFPHGQDNPWVDRWWPGTMEEVETAVARYGTALREAARKYAEIAREAAVKYSLSAEKAIYHYRQYALREYYKGKA